MKWYSVITNDRAVLEPLVTEAHDFRGIDSDALYSGGIIKGWNSDAYLQVSRPELDGDPDDALQNHLDLLIFSPRLRTALAEQGVPGFQFLPIQIIKSTGERLADFAIAHVVELRAALDLERSAYEVFPNDYFLPDRRGLIRSLRRAVLKKAALYDTDAIRLKEFFPRVCVSERFVTAFEEARCTGLSFRDTPVSEG